MNSNIKIAATLCFSMYLAHIQLSLQVSAFDAFNGFMQKNDYFSDLWKNY
jgi:hypothetical protein